jgi:hypothetical protein
MAQKTKRYEFPDKKFAEKSFAHDLSRQASSAAKVVAVLDLDAYVGTGTHTGPVIMETLKVALETFYKNWPATCC